MDDTLRYKFDKDLLLNYDHDNPPRHGSCCYAEFVEARDYDALREQNRMLAREYTRLFNLAKPITTLLQDLKIIPIGCSREQELAWKMAVKNFRHYQQGYDASAAMEAALTATSQPAKPQGRMHACDIPGCVSCGNPEDATSQEVL